MLLYIGMPPTSRGAPIEDDGAGDRAPLNDSSTAPTNPAASIADSPARLRDHPAIAAADAALEVGDLRKCLALLRVAADENPELPPDLLMLSQLYAQRGRWQESSVALENAVTLHRNHPEVYQTCAIAALSQRRLADAWLHFEKALSLPSPEAWKEDQQLAFRVGCLQGMLEICQRRRDWSSAANIYGQLAELTTLDEASLRTWGKSLLLVGDEDGALKKFDEAYQKNQSLNPPALAMAAHYVQAGQWDKADAVYRKELEQSPDAGRTNFEYAGALLLRGDFTRAALHLQKAAAAGSLGDLDVELIFMRGLLARNRLEFSEAERHFSEVLRRKPGHQGALAQLPLVLVEQDEAKQRRALQIAAINAAKNSTAEALATHGWVQYRLGRKEDAEKNLRAALEKGSSGEAIFFLTQLLVDTGRTDDLHKYVEQLKVAIDRPAMFITRDEAREWLKAVSSVEGDQSVLP
jgi:tetratricopeptide (TPR) repeat protein